MEGWKLKVGNISILKLRDESVISRLSTFGELNSARHPLIIEGDRQTVCDAQTFRHNNVVTAVVVRVDVGPADVVVVVVVVVG